MNQQSTLVGLFKEVYGSNIVEAWSFMAKLASKVSFVSQELRNGNNYHQPVDVQFEHGVSVAAAGSVPGAAGGPVFYSPTAGQMQDAQLAGAQLVGRAQVAYESIARSANSAAAFKSATQHVVRRLSQAVLKRLEIQMLHGQRGIGVVSSLATEAGSSGNYTTVVTISDASWSTGIWAGMVGAYIDLYQSDLTTVRQSANINTGVTSGTSGWSRITAIDTVNKTVTLNYGTARSGWAAGDVLFFGSALGGSSSTEMAGLDVITRLSASSGAFQNINATTYDLWRGNQYSAATGVLSFPKLLEAAGLAASYGLMDTLCAVISPRAFEVLNSDIAALRQYDVSYSPAKAKNGTQALTFLAQTGEVEVMPHPFQKDGICHMFTPSEALRIGATDVSFITRQGSEDKLILESSTVAASEMRAYSNQALFISQPRHTVLLDGITY
jgi:hypothetical protein